MPRLMTDDPTRTNPLALLTTAKMAAISDVVAPVNEYLQATGDASITVSQNIVVTIGNAVFETASTNLTVANLDVGSSFILGRDYYVYICDNNTDTEVYLISLNSTYPTGYTAQNSRKLGGFHYGQCRRVDSQLRPVDTSNNLYGTGWESNVFVGIVPRSVYTTKHRPRCAPEGMVYIGAGVWVDIYLSSDDGNGGMQSVYNGVPLTGTEGHNWVSFNDRLLMNGKRMLKYQEFIKAAFGSPQGNDGDNINAWSATTNTGRNPAGAVVNAVSSAGCRDCVGNVWEWLSDIMTNPCPTVLSGTTSPTSFTYASWDGGRGGQTITNGSGHGPTTRAYNSTDPWVSGAWNWDRVSPLGDTTGGNPNNGNVYQYYDWSITALLGGGYWIDGSRTGCRALDATGRGLWHVSAHYGVRSACESL